jgi:hypothetical protein
MEVIGGGVRQADLEANLSNVERDDASSFSHSNERPVVSRDWGAAMFKVGALAVITSPFAAMGADAAAKKTGHRDVATLAAAVAGGAVAATGLALATAGHYLSKNRAQAQPEAPIPLEVRPARSGAETT